MALDLRYARFHASTALSGWFSSRTRARRMEWFLQRMNLRGGERIIDLGGMPGFWSRVPVPLDITIVNLPGTLPPPPQWTRHELRLIEGDACAIEGQADGSYDIAFSNSVIEHVGGPDNRRRLAQEARRLAPRYWVQTPSIWFPIEAHTYMPFWWFYPKALRTRIEGRWHKKLPKWAEMIQDTTVLSRSEMRDLFPDAQIITERVAGLPKSYIAYRA